MVRVAFFPGSFDPMTNGHLDVVRAGLMIADKLVVGVGVHPRKSSLFAQQARIEMLSDVCRDLGESIASRVSIVAYDGLLVDAARHANATIVLRGVRDTSDFDAETRMAAMNLDLASELQTVFVPAAPSSRHVSATLVRQIAKMGGDTSRFVPPAVARRLAELR